MCGSWTASDGESVRMYPRAAVLSKYVLLLCFPTSPPLATAQVRLLLCSPSPRCRLAPLAPASSKDSTKLSKDYAGDRDQIDPLAWLTGR